MRELKLNHTPAMFTSLSECVHSGGMGCKNAKKAPIGHHASDVQWGAFLFKVEIEIIDGTVINSYI